MPGYTCLNGRGVIGTRNVSKKMAGDVKVMAGFTTQAEKIKWTRTPTSKMGSQK